MLYWLNVYCNIAPQAHRVTSARVLTGVLGVVAETCNFTTRLLCQVSTRVFQFLEKNKAVFLAKKAGHVHLLHSDVAELSC